MALLEDGLLQSFFGYNTFDFHSRQIVNCLGKVDFQHLQVLVNLNGAIVGLKLNLLTLFGCLVPFSKKSIDGVCFNLSLSETGVKCFEIETVP